MCSIPAVVWTGLYACTRSCSAAARALRFHTGAVGGADALLSCRAVRFCIPPAPAHRVCVRSHGHHMPLSPSLTFEIESPFAMDHVVERLQDATEPSRWIRFSRRHRTLEGLVSGNQFDTRRIIHERNSFRPRVIGIVSADQSRTLLRGTMTLDRFRMGFLVYWVTLWRWFSWPSC